MPDLPADDHSDKKKARAELVLLKNKSVKRCATPGSGEVQPSLRLIDCRPSLFELFRRHRGRLRLREAAERSLGRFAAFVAAKVRR